MLTLKESILVLCLLPLAMGTTEVKTEALSAVSQGTNQFSSSLFQTIAEENPGNLICSPLSVSIVLAMTAYGAGGETERQIKNVLHLPSSDTLGQCGYQALIDNMNNMKNNTLLLANKIFANNKFNVKPTYMDLTKNYFYSASQLVNFAQSTEAANIINTWVKENTNNRISEIISPSDVNQDTALVLTNAIYFKGFWKNKFNSVFTSMKPFHVNEKTVKDVPTMYIEGDYKYGELSQMNAKFIEIPYQGDTMSMVIILPNEVNGLAEVEKKMKDINLNDILKERYTRKVQLYLPKFKIESKIDLNSPLQKLGLTDAFGNNANFSGIADTPIYISKVVQKAFIEVNEEGSEAAAVTGVIMMKLSLVYVEDFTINRPFYYSIVQKINDGEHIQLFNGYVTEPKI